MNKIGQICLAIGLPVLTLLAFYLLKDKRKKNDDSKDDSTISETEKELRRKLVAGGTPVELQGLVSKLWDEVNEELSQFSHEEIVRQGLDLIGEIDRENDELINQAENPTFSIYDGCANYAEKQVKTKSTVVNSSISGHDSSINLDSADSIYLNNNDKDYQTKLNLSDQKSTAESMLIKESNDDVSTNISTDKAIDMTKDELMNVSNTKTIRINRSVEEPNDELNESICESEQSNVTNKTIEKDSTNSKSDKLEKSTTLNNTKSTNQNESTNKTIDVEDIFDNDLSSIQSGDNGQFTENTTNLTFNTCESSLDSTAATNNSTLDCSNCSNQTLCSQSKSKKDNSSKALNNLKSNASIQDNELSTNEEVKEDLKSTTANTLNSSGNLSNLNLTAKDSKDDDNVNLKQQTICESEQSKTDDIASNNGEEKFLNVTEAEFKNDSKIEIVNEVVEQLKNKVSEEKSNDSNEVQVNGENDESMNDVENDNEANKSTVDCNKTEDDSVCIIIDQSVKEETKPQPQAAATDTQRSISKETSNKVDQATSSQPNLDDSDELEVLYDGPQVTRPKLTKVPNGQSNKKVKDEKRNANSNNHDEITEFVFEIPQGLTGLLIGKKGNFLEPTATKSNTTINLKEHPMDSKMNLCRIKGTSKNIETALNMIRIRFPLYKFPNVTLTKLNSQLFYIEPVEQMQIMTLPEQVIIECQLSQIVTPSHLFLHQYTHPSFNALLNLELAITEFYKNNSAPTLEQIAVGLICAVEYDRAWRRASVLEVDQTGCLVKLLDYGTCVRINSTNDLKQIHRGFMSLPFQATEVILSNIKPVNGDWSQDSINFFHESNYQKILEAYVVGSTNEGLPLIHLFRIESNNQRIMINRELCENGHALWFE